MLAPPVTWWKPLSRMERSWVIVAFTWCLILTIMMPIWFVIGRQNVPVTAYAVTPGEYFETVTAFVDEYQVDTLNGVPVVEPPPGADVYLLARQWQWYPVIRLQKGEKYSLHLSSMDVQHGFSLQPVNLNLQVLPGYDYVAHVAPTQSGEYSIICNEFCGIAHHIMVSKVIVTE